MTNASTTDTNSEQHANMSRAMRAAKELSAESNHARRYQLYGEIDALVGRMVWDGSKHRPSWPSDIATAAGLPDRHVVEVQTEANDIHYTVIDRDNGERYSTTSSTSRDRIERELNRLALGWSGKNVALGIGRINPDGAIEDVTDKR